MSPMRKPSAVDSIRRAAAAPAAPAAAGDHAHVRDLPAVVPPSQRPKPPKPTRFTLDLDDDRHRFLKSFASEAEAKGASEVMRALLDELRDDSELASRVRARIWGG